MTHFSPLFLWAKIFGTGWRAERAALRFQVMPVETVGFTLKPFCFFGGNPGVDVPHTANAASSLAGQTACCATSGDGNGVAPGTNGHR